MLRLTLHSFITFLINDIGSRIMGLLSYLLNIRDQQVVHLLFVYVVLWMKVVKDTDIIDVVIANSWVTIKPDVKTHH